MRRELEAALKLARELPASELPDFLGSLETIRVVGLARITSPAAQPREDRLLTVPEAAARLGVGSDYMYSNQKKFKFARREGRKLLFSSTGLDAYLRGGR